MTGAAASAAAFAGVAIFAAALAAIAAGTAAATPRAYLRFAAGLAAAQALAALLGILFPELEPAGLFATAVSLLVAALAPVAMVLAATTGSGLSALLQGSALCAACLAGLVAAATGSIVLAFAPLMLSATMLAAIAAGLWRRARRPARLLGLASFALVAAAAGYMSGGAEGRTGFALYFAAALLGVTLARRSDRAVEAGRKRPAPRTVFIGRDD